MQLNALTRKSALLAIILLVVILIASALRSQLSPFAIEVANYEYREGVLALVVAVVLLFCGGFVSGRTLPRSGLNKGYCMFPIPLYGLFACGIFVAPNIAATASASLMFALAIYLMLRSLHNAEEKDSILFAAILLGATVLCYPPCVVLAGVVPLAVVILALSVRQALLMVVGYMLPLLAASYAMWYRGDDALALFRNIGEYLATPRLDAITEIPYVAIAMVAVTVVLLVWGFIYAAIHPDKMFLLARVRRALHLFVWIFVLTLTMVFIPARDLSILAIVAVPLTILLSFVLSLLPNNHSTIAYWLLLILFVVHLFVM